ncbi:hypothetical protein C4553_01545 [Candidatus Parcubacteria bacterium]|nr:MAG: hypothetical protein C4553_01545 [Candidatus Parcubacteria bacterium]
MSLNIGEKLKKRRQEKRRSLEEAASKLKISLRKLQALENNQWNKLPAPVYVRGYLAKYSQYLNLSSQEILLDYEIILKERIIQKPSRLPQIENNQFVFSPKAVVVVAIGLFLGIIGMSLIINWASLISPPKLTVEQPSDNLVAREPEIKIVGKTANSVHLTVNGRPVYPDTDGHFELTYNLQSGFNTLEIKAQNNLGKEATIYRRVLLQ